MELCEGYPPMNREALAKHDWGKFRLAGTVVLPEFVKRFLEHPSPHSSQIILEQIAGSLGDMEPIKRCGVAVTDDARLPALSTGNEWVDFVE